MSMLLNALARPLLSKQVTVVKEGSERLAPAPRRGLGVSVGKGSLRYSTRVGGGSRRSNGPTRTSQAAYERQVRQAKRAEEVQAVPDLDIALGATCQVHRYDFEPASKPTLSSLEAVDRQQVKARLKAEALEGISALKFAERRAARKAARERLDAEVSAEEVRRAKQATETQRAWDEFWGRLQANDPDAVLPALEQASRTTRHQQRRCRVRRIASTSSCAGRRSMMSSPSVRLS